MRLDANMISALLVAPGPATNGVGEDGGAVEDVAGTFVPVTSNVAVGLV